MPIVSRGGEEDENESMAAAGAPPGFDVDFDPYDPDQVKVHYNLTGWSFEQRAELAETLAERGVPHTWEGEELVVPEEIEARIAAGVETIRAMTGSINEASSTIARGGDHLLNQHELLPRGA